METNDIDKLKKAIEHCQDVQKENCTNESCKKDHKQLELWLIELSEFKLSVK